MTQISNFNTDIRYASIDFEDVVVNENILKKLIIFLPNRFR